MPRIYASLTRHGVYHQPADTPSAHLPHPLTEEGEAQARAAGGKLVAIAEERGWDVHPIVHCSSLLRAWQTAGGLIETAARGASMHRVATPLLAERSVGSMANLTLAQIDAVVAKDPRYEPLPPRWKSRSEFKLPFPGAESLLEAGTRCGAYIDGVCADVARRVERDTVVVFVGHGGALRHAAVHLGVLSVAQAPTISMWHASSVYLERRADGAWTHAAGAWKPRSKPLA